MLARMTTIRTDGAPGAAVTDHIDVAGHAR
jgi:hypothetical protein